MQEIVFYLPKFSGPTGTVAVRDFGKFNNKCADILRVMDLASV